MSVEKSRSVGIERTMNAHIPRCRAFLVLLLIIVSVYSILELQTFPLIPAPLTSLV